MGRPNFFSKHVLTGWGLSSACVFLFLVSVPATAQIFNRPQAEPAQTGDPGFPTALKGKVQALKGQQATIELEAQTKSPASLVEFLIRDFPLAGTVESLDIKKSNHRVAVMKYTPKLNTAATTDFFTYSVRYPNGRWSAPVKYEIDLVDAVPNIEVQRVVEFGRTMVGSSTKKEIFVKNSGRAIFDKTLKLPDPWVITEPANGRLQLPIGGSKLLKVEFRPMRTEVAKLEWTINRNPGGTVSLRGDGYAPFSMKDREVKLELNKKSGIREGVLEVVSHAEKIIQVNVRAGERVVLMNGSPELYLSPGQTTEVPIGLGANDATAYNGTVEFSTPQGFIANAKVKADLLPGRLEVEIPGSPGGTLINFGNLLGGKSAQTGLVLKNVGGAPITVETEAAEPFKILMSGNGQLAPKTAQPLAISFSPGASDSGLFDEFLYLRTANQELKIRLLGVSRLEETPAISVSQMRIGGINSSGQNKPSQNVGGGAASSQPAAAIPPGAINQGQQLPPSMIEGGIEKVFSPITVRSVDELNQMRSQSGFITRPLKERKIVPTLRPLTTFRLDEPKKDELVISMVAPKNSEDYDFEIERRSMMQNPETGVLMSVWEPHDNVSFQRDGNRITAQIKGLLPNQKYEFRSFTVNANGHSSPPSHQFFATTALPMDWTYIYGALAVILIGVIFWGLFRIIKNRRESERAERARNFKYDF